MSLSSSVTVCECWARDGLQSMYKIVHTEEKINMINRIQNAGVKKLELTSFANPKLIPQFYDSVEVLKGITRYPDVSYVVLIPNAKGFERLALCQQEGYGADEIILMISASEKYNLLNFRMSHERAFSEHAAIMDQAHQLGVKIIGCAGAVFGCPVKGDISIDDVMKVIRFYIDAGAQSIMLGDTTGMANPLMVKKYFRIFQEEFPETDFIAHFHDTRGTGMANSIAALETGIQSIDSSLGAIGGQPATGAGKYSLGFTGNTCSEDLIAVLEEMGVNTGINLDLFIEAGKQAEEILEQKLRSNVIHAGPVLHEESAVNKEAVTNLINFS